MPHFFVVNLEKSPNEVIEPAMGYFDDLKEWGEKT